MDKQPLFSVIVPIYNVEKYLNQCIDSILAQTFDDFELLLIDDGSSDGCPAICDAYARKDGRVRVIHRENGGIVRARETGILAALGKYVCWVDGDDFVSEELLEHMHHILKTQNEPDIICFDYVRYYENREPQLKPSVDNDPAPGLYDKKRLEQEIYPYMMRDSRKKFATFYIYPSFWSKCFRRELVSGHYCKDPRITVGDDEVVIYECLFFADTVFCSDKVLYYYRYRENSIVHAYNEKYVGKYVDQRKLEIRYLREHLEPLSESLGRQAEDWYIAHLIIAVFKFPRNNVPLLKARRELKEILRRTGILQDIRMAKTVPLHARAVVMMLRCHLYLTVLIMAKLFVALG